MNEIKQMIQQSDTVENAVSISCRRIESTVDFAVSTLSKTQCQLKNANLAYGATMSKMQCRTMSKMQCIYISTKGFNKIVFILCFIFGEAKNEKCSHPQWFPTITPLIADNFYRVFPAYFSRCLAILFYGG